ncbi:MAG: hypothetical protein JW878_10290 [Methanomicrobia archaeon]|nr:hypothetical protein [Methanomicrobia archaeon]
MSNTKKENENACNKNFVLDTNFYLHYKLFTELDWKSLLGCNNLILIVPPTVIKELDDKKFSAPNSRIKRRAQEVISKFRDISEGKSIPCGFQINFLESIIEEKALRDLHLNPDNSDDKIIAATLAFREQNADERY